MNRYFIALCVLTCSIVAGSASAQKYTYSVINTGVQSTTIQRPYAINDSGLVLLQPYTAFNNSLVCLLIKGTTITQTEQYLGSDQYYSLSNNGFITGTGIYGVYYLDDLEYNINTIPVPSGDTGYPTGVNSSQLVVGMANSPTSGTYAWTSKNGSFTKYVYPGSTGCTLNGVNDSGDLVGTYFVNKLHNNYYAFAVIKGKPSAFTVPGCVDPTPSAISTNDIVAGTAVTSVTHQRVGFVRSKAGAVVTIDYKPQAPASISGPKGTAKLTYYGTEVFGVNSSGVIVGLFTATYVTADGTWAETEYIPFMATPK